MGDDMESDYVELGDRTLCQVDIGLSSLDERTYCVVPGWYKDLSSDPDVYDEEWIPQYELAFMVNAEHGETVDCKYHLTGGFNSGIGPDDVTQQLIEDIVSMRPVQEIPVVMIDEKLSAIVPEGVVNVLAPHLGDSEPN